MWYIVIDMKPGRIKCPECGRKGHLQGMTLDGNFNPRPQAMKCANGHEWPAPATTPKYPAPIDTSGEESRRCDESIRPAGGDGKVEAVPRKM